MKKVRFDAAYTSHRTLYSNQELRGLIFFRLVIELRGIHLRLFILSLGIISIIRGGCRSVRDFFTRLVLTAVAVGNLLLLLLQVAKLTRGWGFVQL